MFTGRRLGELRALIDAISADLKRLQDRVEAVERDTDHAELERMRGSVLNALRALRRSQQAQDEREAVAKGSDGAPPGEDAVGRLLRIRRGG